MLHVISGHAPGHIRNEFETLAEDRSAWPSPVMRRLIGRLWNCTDIMPSMLRAELDESPGSTYAQGVRSLRQHLRARLNRERDASASAGFLLVIRGRAASRPVQVVDLGAAARQLLNSPASPASPASAPMSVMSTFASSWRRFFLTRTPRSSVCTRARHRPASRRRAADTRCARPSNSATSSCSTTHRGRWTQGTAYSSAINSSRQGSPRGQARRSDAGRILGRTRTRRAPGAGLARTRQLRAARPSHANRPTRPVNRASRRACWRTAPSASRPSSLSW